MTELEKLKNTASVIHDLTHGRIRMQPSGIGHICIHAAEDAYINLSMEIRSNLEEKCYDISFSSFVRKMGRTMNSGDLGTLYKEVHQVWALQTALELTKLHPTLEDLQEFHTYLQQQQEQSQTETSMEAQAM